MPVVAEETVRLSWYRALAARAAVGVARLLILLPPRRLRLVLTALSRGSRPATAAQALRARQAVVSVSARCAGQGCLQRSVAAVLLARLSGRWPDWCTGIRTAPFRAHAWLEVAGDPVGEPPDTALYRATMTVRHDAGPRR
ncbi:MAG: lasso peptide biosynthesis B2 protein [Actinophytocola sp.]|uniref:lasso peptide biosynthesis B2 protein n=1 Tax=Actinophytocola sp. TaxID=1872138 RepID=UPI003C750E56